jgi:microcystin-dependent protein
VGEPYIGEIRMFAGNFAPAGWAFCNGQLMPISENDALFTLIGTTYGGDGQQTFALPDLQGRIPMHPGSTHGPIGEKGGVESVTLTTNQIPVHTHAARCNSNNGTQSTPLQNFWAASAVQLYVDQPNAIPMAMNPNNVGPTGGSQPHENMGPFLVISFILSLFGVFPTQT